MLPQFESCSSCGDAPTQPYQSTDCPECDSQSGKYFDKLTTAFTMPADQTEGFLYVCDVNLWASKMWIGVCNNVGGVAALRITGISQTHNYLKVFNGCQGKPIPNNSTPGTTFDAGTPVYGISPKCDSPDNTTLAILEEAIKVTKAACFIKIPADDSDINEHVLIGATFGEGGGPTTDPSFWKTCLRKIRMIWLGMYGRTLCFKDIPITNNNPTIVGDTTFNKRYMYLDTYNNCLKAGPTITESSVCNSPPVEATGSPSEHFFDKIIVCVDGLRKAIEPIEGSTIIGKKNGDGVLKWSLGESKNFEYINPVVDLRAYATRAAGTYSDEIDLTSHNPPTWANYAIINVRSYSADAGSDIRIYRNNPDTGDTYFDRAYHGGFSVSEANLIMDKTTKKIKIKFVVIGVCNYGLRLVGWAR